MKRKIVREAKRYSDECSTEQQTLSCSTVNSKGNSPMFSNDRRPILSKLVALFMVASIFLSAPAAVHAAPQHTLAAATACTGPARGKVEILIPLYSYPIPGAWDDVAAAACKIPITAIINPNNGEISGAPDTNYKAGVKALRDAGVTILGYVYTGNGTRNFADVQVNIDAYNEYWDVDGIFVDEADAEAALNYYKWLYTYIGTKDKLDRVVLNPGRTLSEEFFTQGAADSAVIFEDFGDDWPFYTPDPYVANSPAERFAMMVHSEPSATAMHNYIDLAVQRNFRYVYVTDADYATNAWDEMPSYWADEVAYIAQINTDHPITMGEVGYINDALTDAPMTIALQDYFINPVVFAQPLSYDGVNTAVVRITDVQSEQFTLYVQESPDQDGRHARTEAVSYIVFEAGSWDLANGAHLEVGTVDSTATTGSRIAPRTWEQVNFATAFAATPVVVSQVQGDNDATWVKTRQKNTNTTGFQMAMEPADSATSPHGSETLGWFALQSGNSVWDGHRYEASTVGGVTHNWATVNFTQGFTAAPRFIGAVGSYVGADGVAIRYDRKSLTSSGVNIMLEEDTTFDAEIDHAGETIRYLAIEGDGLLTATVQGTVQPAATQMVIDEGLEVVEGLPQKIFVPLVTR